MIQEEVLLSFLIQKNFLSEQQARAVLNEAKNLNQRVEEVIISKNLIDEKKLVQAKGELFQLPVKFFEANESVPRGVLNLISEDVSRTYFCLAFNKEGSTVSIGMVYPDDVRAQETVKFLMRSLGLDFRVYVISLSDFREVSKQYQSLTDELSKLLDEFKKKFETQKKKVSPYHLVDLEQSSGAVEEAPIIKLFAAILKYAVRSRASDIHLEPEREVLRVRFRVDGNLSTVITLPLMVHAPIISRIKIMANLKIDENRLPQDGRFVAMIDEKEIDFRVATYPTSLGEKAAIRILDPTIGLKSIYELGLMGQNLEILESEIKKPYGMILITGPTGSGKTTTLYAILHVLNQDGVNIVSLEDPVEYTIEGINQSQVLPEIDYTFARGLRHLVRQDPDIIMVGEIRDNETASLAVQSALTGHLVLSTLHTNNAIGVIPRLMDMGVEPFLIPSSVNLMVAQRLGRRLCPDCKEKILANEIEAKIIEENLATLPAALQNKWPKPYYIYKAKGCRTCNNKGYLGRVGLFEALKMTPELEQIILTQPSQDQLHLEAKRQGMISLRQDGILKVLEGVMSLEEVLAMTGK
jgi:type IV pilus assembly protein PilB